MWQAVLAKQASIDQLGTSARTRHLGEKERTREWLEQQR